MFLFKILGLFVGNWFAGLGGAIMGFILGHAFDAGLAATLQRKKFERHAKRAAEAKFNQTFISSTFGMLSTLAHADGIVNDAELAVVQRVSDHYLRLNRPGKKFALEVFQNAAATQRGFHSYAVEFYEATQGDPGMAHFALNALMEMAAADGPLNETEVRFLKSAADVFNLGEEADAAEHLFNSFQGQSADQNGQAGQGPDYYGILGCRREDSDETIKRNYRQLISDYHPDRIVSKDLPEDFVRFANEKFRIIHEAYNAVKKERGIS
jgi:DnaJ like chaperone protein